MNNSVKIKKIINVIESAYQKKIPPFIVPRIAAWISMMFGEFLINHFTEIYVENSYGSVQKLSSTKRTFLYFISSICYLFLFIQMTAITMIHSFNVKVNTFEILFKILFLLQLATPLILMHTLL